MHSIRVWWDREVDSLTEVDIQRIRGMWITLPFAYPFARWLAMWLVERFF